MNVRYYIDTLSVRGLIALLSRRPEILASVLNGAPDKTDKRPLADRTEDAWRDQVVKFWIEHPILSKFTKKEISFVLGSLWPVQIVTESPEIMLSGPRVLPDCRVDLHHSDVGDERVFRVCMVEFDHIEFERGLTEADPRGTYSRSFNNGSVHGVVALQNGKYRLTVQLGCQLDSGAWINMESAFEEMTRFAFDVIRGELKPDNYTTVSG